VDAEDRQLLDLRQGPRSLEIPSHSSRLFDEVSDVDSLLENCVRGPRRVEMIGISYERRISLHYLHAQPAVVVVSIFAFQHKGHV
jgi:hypothetical protein